MTASCRLAGQPFLCWTRRACDWKVPRHQKNKEKRKEKQHQ